jgi:hypothetical protein
VPRLGRMADRPLPCGATRAAQHRRHPRPPCMRLYNWPRRRRSVPKSPSALLSMLSLMMPVTFRPPGRLLTCSCAAAHGGPSKTLSPRVLASLSSINFLLFLFLRPECPIYSFQDGTPDLQIPATARPPSFLPGVSGGLLSSGSGRALLVAVAAWWWHSSSRGEILSQL